MKQRCRERLAKSQAIEAAEIEEKRKEKVELCKMEANEAAEREREVEDVERSYTELSHRLYIITTGLSIII